MLYIKNLEEGLSVFKALGSELRIRLIKLLLENREMNMNELAFRLGVTNGALTSHIKKLEESGIVTILTEHSGHGNQKICRVNVDKILIDIQTDDTDPTADSYSVDLPVGHYFNYSVQSTCGLATEKKLIGEVDDPRYFAHPDHVSARILWFSKGFVEYRIPNLMPAGHTLDQLTLSFEISSEAPGTNNDYPSDIEFLLNDRKLGTWTSPGDFGDIRGVFTPSWWRSELNQYGLLKTLFINQDGTFIDGLKLSDITIQQLALTSQDNISFRFQVQEPSRNIGGLTLFGRNFGNYNQDIKITVDHSLKK